MTIDLRGKTNQFGYIYIQPWESDKLIFDDSAVKKALYDDKALPSTAYQAHTWPTSPLKTNFRMALPDYQQPEKTNYGHSEYLLLANNGFGEMLSSFISNHKGCPQYVILYSTLLPCMYPANPVSPGNDRVPRCVEMTFTANDILKKSCPGALFFLYTIENSNKYNLKSDIHWYFKKKGIFLIHPTNDDVQNKSLMYK